jgi:hypothetical protein
MKTAAQQKAIDQARADKAAREAAVKTKPGVIETVIADSVSPSYFDQALEMARTMGITIPGWKRSLLAFVASFVTGFGVGYIGGTLINILMVATFTVTSSMFLTYAMAIVAFLLTMYVGIKAGQKVGMYIATGDIDRDLIRARDYVKGLFTSPEKTIVAAA